MGPEVEGLSLEESGTPHPAPALGCMGLGEGALHQWTDTLRGQGTEIGTEVCL